MAQTEEKQFKLPDDFRRCIREYQKEYYEKNKTKCLEYNKKYNEPKLKGKRQYSPEEIEAKKQKKLEYDREYHKKKYAEKKLKKIQENQQILEKNEKKEEN